MDWNHYDPTLPCQTNLGDAWAKVVENALSIAQPLPGDSAWIAWDPLKQRFHVVKETRPFYAIYDRHQLCQAEIHEEYLKYPYFRIGFWYASQLCLKFRIPDLRGHWVWTMGDALGQNTAEVLCSGITTLYPSQQLDMDDELCFEVIQNRINMWCSRWWVQEWFNPNTLASSRRSDLQHLPLVSNSLNSAMGTK